jgi:hypothetical protein
MTLTDTGHSWGIDGPGASRARLAWASESDGHLTYDICHPDLRSAKLR